MKVSDLFVASEGNHGILLKNTVKMEYPGSDKLYARTLSRVFMAHEGLHDAQSPGLKARRQLGPFLVSLRVSLTHF